MELSTREFWTVLHGMIFGAIYLLAFAGGFAGLWSLRKNLVTQEGMRERLRRMTAGVWIMAITCWATVLTGTYLVYPWYRAKVPDSPKSLLLSNPYTAEWHTFGMEWKEHVAWLAPILATTVAFIVTYYGAELAERPKLRKMALVMFCLAFFAAGVAGALGAFINKVAPIR